jgi:hypothetical protein
MDKQIKKYHEVIQAIGEVLQQKNTNIDLKDYELGDLKKKLKEAEKQLSDLKKQ